MRMQQPISWSWVESLVRWTIELWNGSSGQRSYGGAEYTVREQRRREGAYDEALRSVEREARSAASGGSRDRCLRRVTEAFARFSGSALDLEPAATDLLIRDFLPTGIALARWARRFDPGLTTEDITQACRNAWTVCGLQPLLGEPIALTPAVLGYSLLYPYSDNLLDRTDLAAEAKLDFSRRFRDRLRGEGAAARQPEEQAMWELVALIEQQYPRRSCPCVFESLLAIHRAQEESLAQLSATEQLENERILRISCAKGGSSVLADACLVRGALTEEESRFAFLWGVLLQLGDDLQDVREDLQRGSATLFTRAVRRGQPLDELVLQLLTFSDFVALRMDHLRQGSAVQKKLLHMSWRSLILMAVAWADEFFTPGFLAEAESRSAFRFSFLRARRRRLSGRQGLYSGLFGMVLESPEAEGDAGLPGVPFPSKFSSRDAVRHEISGQATV